MIGTVWRLVNQGVGMQSIYIYVKLGETSLFETYGNIRMDAVLIKRATNQINDKWPIFSWAA
jgi:hypothetical protein